MSVTTEIGLLDRMVADGIWINPDKTQLLGFNEEGQATWKVTFTNNANRRLTVKYHNAIVSGVEFPETSDVFYCYLSDASHYETVSSFEEFAHELGWDLSISGDRRAARKAYAGCEKAKRDLGRFLGDEYDAYMWDTDHCI